VLDFTKTTVVVSLALFAFACGGSGPPPGPAPGPTPTPVPTDFVATAADFRCLAEQPRVRNLRIANTLGFLDEAIALAEKLTPGEQYPIGTILQLVPGEAMVKRGPDFDPENNNWEYFELAVSEAGTEIRVRGRDEVVNQFGGGCFGCHVDARETDFICEKTNGCVDIPLSQTLIDLLQENDPRCGDPATDPDAS